MTHLPVNLIPIPTQVIKLLRVSNFEAETKVAHPRPMPPPEVGEIMTNTGESRDIELLAKSRAALALELENQQTPAADQPPPEDRQDEEPAGGSSSGGRVGLVIAAGVGALALGAGGLVLLGGGSGDEDGDSAQSSTEVADETESSIGVDASADAEDAADTEEPADIPADELPSTDSDESSDQQDTDADQQDTDADQAEEADTAEAADPAESDDAGDQAAPDVPFEVAGVDALGRPIPALPETLVPTTPDAAARPGYPDDPVNAPDSGPYTVIDQGVFYLRGNLASENLRQLLITRVLKLMPAEAVVIEYGLAENDPWYLGGPIPTFLNDNILFETGSNTIKPEFMPIAAIGTNFLTLDPNNRIRIIGHTDDAGDAEENLELSRLRAEAVADIYFSLGASREQIIVEAKGEAEPIADNSTEAGRQANRRVQFEVFSINN